jgi:hypothetical protein
MKHRLIPATLLLIAPFLTLLPSALASSTRYVNGVTGSDSNTCLSPTTACKTIGHAISLSASGDSIRVAAATYKENLGIGTSLSIFGTKAATTIIDGGGVATVVRISSTTAHVTLSGLTIRNGLAQFGQDGEGGGGIYNSGVLKLVSSIVSGNATSAACIRLCGAQGGGIYNAQGTVTISNSTLSGNTARVGCRECFAGGGAIFNLGTTTINDSTLSGNSAVSSGIEGRAGGGAVYNAATLMINNSTLNGNTGAGAIDNGATVTISSSTLSGNTGDIYNTGSATLQNTIVANSSRGPDCSGTMTSKGYNLSSDPSCDLSGPGDMNDINPVLGPLQNNGGPTQTMALLAGSPAIDAGNPSGCTDGQGHLLTTDQRGDPRPDKEDGGGCDIGAYEHQSN